MSAPRNDEVRSELELLERAGHRFESVSGSGHIKVRLSNGKVSFLPSSPSDRRWRENSRSDVARLLGISKRQLEAEMGITKPNVGRARTKPSTSSSRPKIHLVHDKRNDPEDPLHLTPAQRLNGDLSIQLVSEVRQDAQRAGDRVTVQRATRLLQSLYEDKRRSAGPTPAA